MLNATYNANASASTKTTQAEKTVKLKDAPSKLVEITKEIKQQIESLTSSDD